MIDSFSSQIKVAIRVRPILASDYKLSRQKGLNNEMCVQVKSSGESVSLVKDMYHSKDFRYDQVFGHLETQRDVYEKGCQQLVHDFTSGYNACLLCYGQSGTGKTYTMFGDTSSSGVKWDQQDKLTGIMQYSLVDIFDYIHSCRSQNKFAKLYVSFYEIYLECVRDLLLPKRINRGSQLEALNIRECPERGTYIEGLSIFEVEDFDSMYELIHRAVAKRVSRSQSMNNSSSRSHAIVRLVLEHEVSVPTEHEDTEQLVEENPLLNISHKTKLRKNIFTFGDLAGSERLSKSGSSSGVQLKESQNINKSISALGNCVQALAFASNKREKGGITAAHIPFRDSKLTRLLADALSGNTKTYFISTVGPCSHSYTETLSTLSFASRAASVKKLVIKVKPTKDLFADLSRELYDWQWPAVYRKTSDASSSQHNTARDDSEWVYDHAESVAGSKSEVTSTKLSINEFLSQSSVTTVPTPSYSHPSTSVSRDLTAAEIINLQNDLSASRLRSNGLHLDHEDTRDRSFEYHRPRGNSTPRRDHNIIVDSKTQSHDSSPHNFSDLFVSREKKTTSNTLDVDSHDNSLLFALASDSKGYASNYFAGTDEGKQDSLLSFHHDEYRSSGGGDDQENLGTFLDDNLYLSFPPHQQRDTLAPSRSAPPIPALVKAGSSDELIRYEKPLRSALKSQKPFSSKKLDNSIINELDTLSDEIKSLRENLANFDHSSGTSNSNRQKEREEGDGAYYSRGSEDNGDRDGSGEHSGGRDYVDTDDMASAEPDPFYENDIFFTVGGDGDLYQDIEKQIIGYDDSFSHNDNHNDNYDYDATLRDETLRDFSIQDFDDELNKIQLENNLKLSSSSSSSQHTSKSTLKAPKLLEKKKELRFDTDRYEISGDMKGIKSVSLTTSTIKRYRVPPPPPIPHPTKIPCDSCDTLTSRIYMLEIELANKTEEVTVMRELIHLNHLQIPAVSVRDGGTGVFF